MSIFWRLVKINLNVNFGISALKYRYTREKRKRWEPVLIAIGAMAGIIPIITVYTLMLLGIFRAGNMMKQPEIVLTAAFLLEQLLVLIFGVFYIMGAFYFSQDINILIPMPLKPYQITGSKFLTVMVNEYLTALPLLIPPLVIYGAGTGQGLLFWLKGVALILLSPVIPLTLGALFVVLLMRFVNVRKSKDLLAVIGGFLGILTGIGINFFSTRIPEGNGEEFFRNFIASRNGLTEMMGRRFPPAIWATYGLSESGLSGWANFLLFTAVSVVLFATLLWLSNAFFLKGLLSGQETGRLKKSQSAVNRAESFGKATNPVIAVFMKEWRLLLRTPVYVLNGLAGAVMGPLMLVFTLAAPRQPADFGSMLEVIRKPEIIVPVSLGGLGLMLFTSGMNTVASTAVSREGRYFWIARVIPVAPSKQVAGKLLQSFSVSVIGVVTTALILIFALKLGVLRVAVLTALGLIGAMLLAALGLMTDVIHPKLVWNTPQEAMKRNVNGIIGILIALVIMGVLAAVSVAMLMLKVPEWVVYPVLALVLGLFTVISVKGLFALADRRYFKYEI